MALLDFVLCQPVHYDSCTKLSLHAWARFPFREIFIYGASDLFLLIIHNLFLLRCAAHVIAVDASSSRKCTCINERRQTSSTICLLSFPRRKAQAVSASYTQSKAQKDHPQRISWLLVAISNATRIALRRYWTWWWPFQVRHFEIVTTHFYITTADWCRLYKLLDVLLDVRICSPAMISANTLMEPPSCFKFGPSIPSYGSQNVFTLFPGLL